MNPKQRFEYAIAGYKDVSDQLRRWETARVTRGISAEDAKKAAHQYLKAFDLFGLHSAMFALERNASVENIETFERALQRFEAAINQLRATLSNDGVPFVV